MASKLQLDEVKEAPSAILKVEVILSLLSRGSVLVYGTQALYEALRAA